MVGADRLGWAGRPALPNIHAYRAARDITPHVEEMALPLAAAPLFKQVPLLALSADGSGTFVYPFPALFYFCVTAM